MTRIRRYAIAVGSVALAAGVLFALMRDRPATVAAPSPLAAPSATPAPVTPAPVAPTPARSATPAAAATPRRSAPPAVRAHQWPDDRTPFGDAVKQVQAWADAGDTRAAIELTSQLSTCTPYGLRATEASDESDRQYIMNDLTDDQLTKAQRETRRANTMQRINENAKRRADCAALPRDLVAHWLDPLDRAAQSGDTYAMREYARLAMAEYDGVAAVVADVDEAITRRDKARAYLDEAVRLGDTSALVALAGAYAESATINLYAVDAARAHAYAYAALQAAELTAMERDRMTWLLNRSARALDASALAQAEAEGRRLYARCCSGR
ncbi:hypothetical protein FHW12_003165 [Dokdonella fugitiva]|uniref:Uncharacterized protein n=1 Tax=Dokdonella fugitiva TaxID=328517 RepID=A0A839F544_9GAMM|nr:hypothetical protein [Dokdonella fugitiva]MBA8888929.1 hypothetical protein [Dokdonella fugitiva]